MDCRELRDVGPELALGLLSGRRRSLAMEHLAGCGDCRDEVRSLTDVTDLVVETAPIVEPPPGFESRVLARIDEATTQQRPRRWRAAAVAAAVVVAGLAGFGVRGLVGADRPVTASPAAAMADLRSTAGVDVGQAVLTGGDRPWLFMTVEGQLPSGHYVCHLVTPSGRDVAVGSFEMASGYGYWASGIALGPDGVRQVRVVGPSGAVVASGPFNGL
ncbi:MAG TPA: hypothetical protein VFH45_07755 [Acidimicrobiales bacterium]|nr:hypothetical protein [Acidimicrobiales bacterium]